MFTVVTKGFCLLLSNSTTTRNLIVLIAVGSSQLIPTEFISCMRDRDKKRGGKKDFWDQRFAIL